MIHRQIEWSSPDNKPTYVDYRVSGTTAWIPVPEVPQPAIPNGPILIQLIEATYYDFRFTTECSPGNLSAPEYLMRVFSKWACQAPSEMTVTVLNNPIPNDNIQITWADNMLLEEIPGLAVQLDIVNSLGVTIASQGVNYAIKNPNPPYNWIKGYLWDGILRSLPPDNYTMFMTVLCGRGPVKISRPFSINAPSCPDISGLTFTETINTIDQPNHFKFTWTNNTLDINGYDWQIYNITGGGNTYVASGTTAAGITTVDYDLPKNSTFKFQVRGKCQYNNSNWAEISFQPGYPACQTTSIWINETQWAGLDIYAQLVARTFDTIPSTTPGVPRVRVYAKMAIRYGSAGNRCNAPTPCGIYLVAMNVTGSSCIPLTQKRIWTGPLGSFVDAKTDGSIEWLMGVAPGSSGPANQIVNYEFTAEYNLD